MADVVYTVDGAAAVEEAQERVNTKADKGTQSYKQLAAENRRYGRIATQIARNNETATERYNRKLSDAKRALRGNVNETELLKRETTRLRLEFLRSQDANTKLLRERRDAAKEAVSEFDKLGNLADRNADLFSDATQSGAELGNTLDDAVDTQESLIGAAAITQIGQYAAAFLGAHQAMSLITQEFQTQRELLNEQQQTQLTVSESRNVLLRNLIGRSEEEIAAVQASVRQVSALTGVSEQAINLGFAEAVSASGGNLQASTKAVEAAAKFLSDAPQDIGEFAGTLLDLAKVTASSDARINLGLLSQVGQLGRITDPRLQARNIAPALIGTTAFGGTARGSGALFAALTTAGADVQGERTRTALISLAEQLSNFEPVQEFATLRERVQALQADRGLAEQFLGDASFEKAVVGPIRQLLLDSNSVAARNFAANLAAIPDVAGLGRVGDQALGIFQFNRLNPVAAADRALSQAVEEGELQRQQTQLTDQQREKFRKVLRQTGSGPFELFFQDFLAGFGDGPGLSVQQALSALQTNRDAARLRGDDKSLQRLDRVIEELQKLNDKEGLLGVAQ